MPIEKDITYIKLANAPLTVEGNAKHSTDGDRIYHRTESLVKANAWLLVKTFNNKVSFIPCNRAIGILFNEKHPFFAHYILCPGLRGNRAQVLFRMRALHRHNPLGVLKSLGNTAWFSERRNHGSEAIFWVGFDDYISSTGLHGMIV